MQSGIVPIKVGVPVVGDVTVAVWFGAYNLGQRLHSRPALAFAFHTAFADPGSVRITVEQLDLADAALIPSDIAKGFFIDVILTEQAEVLCPCPSPAPHRPPWHRGMQSIARQMHSCWDACQRGW